MNYFEEQETKDKEKRAEEKYQEIYQKQSRIARIVFLATFLPMGIIFILLGIIFLCNPIEKEVGIVFLSCGVAFCLLGGIFILAMPKKGNYQRYKVAVKKRGGLNLFDLSVRVSVLEESVKDLELENQSLKRQIEDLRR